jgi:hypothetical protein
MFKKVLFIAALSGAILTTGALTTAAQAHTLTTTVSTATQARTLTATSTTPEAQKPADSTISQATKLFDLSGLDKTHRDLVIEALEGFDYDWSQMKAGLKAKTGKTQIPINVVNIPSKWNACGLSWPNGVVEIDDQVIDPVWFKQVVQHEVGHMVDFFHLGPAKLHGKIAKVYGDSWAVMNHNFNTGFIQVMSNTSAFDPAYPLTEAQQQELRRLLGGTQILPFKMV